jgi:hypothetical protein
MRNAIVLTAGLLCASAAASAADNGIYFGGSIGQANVEVDQGLAQIDGDDTGFKFIVGVRPLDWLAVEASYVDFGEVDSGLLSAEGDGITAFVVGMAAVGPVDIFAKGGLINFDTSVAADGIGDVFKDDGTDMAYGVGVQFRLLSLGVRAEYEVFDVDNVEDLNMLSIGVTYTFL